MIRALPAVAGIGAALALAACGSGSSASTTGARSTPSPQANGGGNGLRSRGAAGELVQLGSTSLVLNTQTGDVTVDYTSSTPVTRTHTGTLADVATGMCITATGQKDATGALTASGVMLSAKVNGSCRGPLGFGGGGPERSPGATPRPTFTPRPGTPPLAFARGEITAVSGTSVTVLAASGSSTTITVPTTARISVTDSATTSDLNVGDCVLAAGSRNSAGVVTARSLNVVPAGPSGCFSGGGGFGGFGGFRGGGGGGGGGGFGGGFGGGGGDGGGGGAGG